MKRVSRNKLETGGLNGAGLGEENALGERGKHRGWVVVKSGVEATRVVALKARPVRRPFEEYALLGGEGRGPIYGKLGRLFSEGVEPVHLVHPCPSL